MMTSSVWRVTYIHYMKYKMWKFHVLSKEYIRRLDNKLHVAK